jgi:hypothetical protein
MGISKPGLLSFSSRRKQTDKYFRRKKEMSRIVCPNSPVMGGYVVNYRPIITATTRPGPRVHGLLDQIISITNGTVRCSMGGKRFPIGPRHVCMPRNEITAPPPQQQQQMAQSRTYTFKLPSSATGDAAATDAVVNDFVILEADAPANARVFDSWLTPCAPDPSRRVFCPVRVPGWITEECLVEPLIKAWKDKGVVVADEQEGIAKFFKALGDLGEYVTLSGDIAHVKDGLVEFRIPTWPSQWGGFLTQDEGHPVTFCGVICGVKSSASNTNDAVDASRQRFLQAYRESVLPTLRLGDMPAALKKLLA